MGIFARIKKAWYDSIIWETIDEDFYDELEESLIMADLGAAVAADAVKELRKVVYEKSIQRGDDVKQALRDILEKKLEVGDTNLDLSTTPSVVLIIGVNGVGKTTSIGKLASRYKKQGKRVLLVDMDYRSPMLGRYLGRRNKKDIMDYLNGGATLQEVVSKTGTRNLYFMDSCHRIGVNASLAPFDRFLEETRQYFDLVVFDTSPLGMFIDAASLAAKTDGTVVIVADGRVDRKELQKVLDQLHQVKAQLLGIAFNFVQHRQKSYYYNKYYRYGSQHKEERRSTRELKSRAIEDEDDEYREDGN